MPYHTFATKSVLETDFRPSGAAIYDKNDTLGKDKIGGDAEGQCYKVLSLEFKESLI